MMAKFPATIMLPEPRLTVRVAASEDGVRATAEALDWFEADHALDPDAGWPIHVALDEVLSNVVRHGSVGQQDPLVQVTFSLTGTVLEVAVVDDGPEWNPLARPEPDTGAPLEARRPGGLGVHLVRHLMDGVAYAREDGRNRLVFARQYAGTGPRVRRKE
jgi:serine/threonine-protein kinase RsbW